MKKHILEGLAAVLAALAVPSQALEAHRLGPGERIAVDGRVDDAAWSRAERHDRFWELFPRDKVAARVRTEFRIAYDDHALYAAIRAFDPDVGLLREPFTRRDNVLSDQDMLVLNIDPIGNRKFAHFFRVNPRGSIGDGLYNEDTGSEDFSPDFEFEVATGRFEGGWTAEFRVPFSSLRYAEPPSREWSVMVYRTWPREQRYRMSSSPLAREPGCFLCLNEPLTGLEHIPPARHLAITPNATVRGTRTRDAGRPRDDDWQVVPSVDVKWRPRADIVFDATLNPDFSQVELDTPQLAVNAQFALFFPEKRPFFLEGADILESPMRAIYTRSVTDPAWGARITQRTDRFDGAVLVARDGGGGLVLLPGPYGTGFARQDFKSLASFARGRWQVGGATLGALLTDRSLEGGGYNRVAGPDLTWFPSTEHRLRAQLLGSATSARFEQGRAARGEARSSHAALLDWRYRGRRWDQYLNIEDVGGDFRADNGFFGQNGYRRLYSETARKFLGAWGFNEVSPYLNAEYKTDRAGEVIYRQHHLGLRFGLPRATAVWMEWRPSSRLAVRSGGGLRKRDQGYVGFESNPWPWLSRLFAEVAFGDRLDVANNRIGRGTYVAFEARMRPHPRAEIEYRLDDDVLDSLDSRASEGGKRIIRQRAQQLLAIWHFTARDSLRAILQDARVRRTPALWSFPVSARENSSTVSVVYGHRRGIGTTLYVGATFGRVRDADAGVRRDQAEVFVKGSWSFDVL